VRLWRRSGLDDDFGEINQLLAQRSESLKLAIEHLEGLGSSILKDEPETVFRLAAADLFVEKAQAVLTGRARRMSAAGVVTSGFAIAFLIGLGIYIARHTATTPNDLGRNSLILRVVSAISLGAIVLVAVKYLIALSRSFFHESVSLLSRRHALRFGRLYVYLNRGDVDLTHLQEAFDWNRGGDSSFLDIKPSEIGTTPWSQFAKSLGESAGKAFDAQLEKQKTKAKATRDQDRPANVNENER
jgi:hypothetical protein